MTFTACQKVSIREPYDLSSVSSTHPDDGAAIVERVKKVVRSDMPVQWHHNGHILTTSTSLAPMKP